MSSDNAIERLRELLDERGVEYYDHATGGGWRFWVDWSESIGDYTRSVGVDEDDTCYAILDYLTPEQAVDVTLGRGACEMNVLDTGNEAAYEHYEYIMRCEHCGHEFGYVQYNEDGDTWMDEKPSYCPACGRKVVYE